MRRTFQIVRAAAAALAGTAVIMVALAAAAQAGAARGLWAAPPRDLNTVINNIRNWLFGLLVALATLFATVGAIRLLLAGGDPTEVAKAKDTLKNAAYGYGLAVLAPLLVTIVKGFVSG
jgi:hypothetical protein